MFKTFIAGQRLRAGIVDARWFGSDIHAKIRSKFIDAFANDRRGTLLNDIWALDAQPALAPDTRSTKVALSSEVHALLVRRLYATAASSHPRQTVFAQPSITLKGATFSAFSNSPGNSNVVYGSFADGRWSAGRISAIFFKTNAGGGFIACLVVEPLCVLTDVEAPYDPYRGYRSDLTGKLFHAAFEKPIVLLAEDIICHFASTPLHIGRLGVEVIHALPLDRVSDLRLRFSDSV